MGADVLHGFQSMKPLLEDIGQKPEMDNFNSNEGESNHQINSKVNYELKIVAYIRC